MKKIKLFFLAFLSVCLGLTSFSSAGTVADNITLLGSGDFTLDSSLFKGIWDYGSNGAGTYCIKFMSDTSNRVQVLMGFSNANSSGPSNTYMMYGDQYGNWVCLYANKPRFYVKEYSYYPDRSFHINYEIFKFNHLLSSSCGDCSSYVSDLADCQSDLSSCEFYSNEHLTNLIACQSGYDSLSGSLSTCQSDLSSCRGGQDASLLACIDQKEQCESSLTTLSGNYASLENMNSSLSTQLQECLENASNSTGELICNKFDLFRSSENTDYSYPINNDLILPPGYKGFVNEGVLAIKQDSSLDSAYSIDDEEFQDVIDSFGIVFLYVFGSALFLVFLYMIRKYFIGLKS